MSLFVSPVMRQSNRKTGGSVPPTNNASSLQPSSSTRLVQWELGRSTRQNRPQHSRRDVPSYKVTHKIIVVNRIFRYKTRDLRYIDRGRATMLLALRNAVQELRQRCCYTSALQPPVPAGVTV